MSRTAFCLPPSRYQPLGKENLFLSLSGTQIDTVFLLRGNGSGSRHRLVMGKAWNSLLT
jgi:comEA protein